MRLPGEKPDCQTRNPSRVCPCRMTLQMSGTRRCPRPSLTHPHGWRIPRRPRCADLRRSGLDSVLANDRSAGPRAAPFPLARGAVSKEDKRRSLEGYVQLVIARSTGLGRRRLRLSEIDLDTEEGVIADTVAGDAETFAHLSAEDGDRWGALVLYIFARSAAMPRLRVSDRRRLAPAHVRAISAGAVLWQVNGISGADRALAAFTTSNGAFARPSATSTWHLEVEHLASEHGLERIRVRAVEDAVGTSVTVVPVALRVPGRSDVRVKLEDLPRVSHTDTCVHIVSGDQWTELSFRLLGSAHERVPLEVFVLHRDGSLPVEGLFNVVGCAPTEPVRAAPTGRTDDPHVTAEAPAPSSTPLGHFLRLVVLSSRVGGRPIALRDIALLPREEDSLHAHLTAARGEAWTDMSVEMRLVWGALFLFAFARASATGRPDRALFGTSLTPDELAAVKVGTELWIRKEVGGSIAELEMLLAAASAVPARKLADEKAIAARARSRVRVLIRAMPPSLGRYRIAVRAESPRNTSEDILCALVSDAEGAEVIVFNRDQSATTGLLKLTANAPWEQIEFVPYCSVARRVRIELHARNDPPSFRDVRVPGQFPTLVRPPQRNSTDSSTLPPVDRFFEVLALHGVVAEEHAMRIFGSARALRRFALVFDGEVAKRSVVVRIEVGESGKRFVQERER